MPSALTTNGPGERLTDAVVFCHVRSWMTGYRLVSVPFADHCEPLVDGKGHYDSILLDLKNKCDCGQGRYIEIRSSAQKFANELEMTGVASFCLHTIDLRPPLGKLFDTFHRNSIQRKIARADREGVAYTEGTSEQLLRDFYRLMVLTRRRHRLPPQPLSWFQNLIACLGDTLKVRLAMYQGKAVAGILTISYKSSMTYKYGCSDPAFHRFGSMQLLLWRAVQEAKNRGLLEFDMGKTEFANHGLLTFKDHWGGRRSSLIYRRYPAVGPQRAVESRAMRIAKLIFSRMPIKLLPTAGRIVYRHIA
jgi:lipid II:glycine glycyltransferase (peptidoglycan interpeptide bridge formation enzyme)